MLLGSAAGSAGLSYILHTYGYFTAASMVCSFLLLFTCITFFVKEKSTDTLLPCKSCHSEQHRRESVINNRRSHIKDENQLKILWLFKELFLGLLSRESIKYFIPIVLCYMSNSAFIKAYNFHLIQTLKWSDADLSVLSGTWGTVVVIGVIVIGE
jgi:PAT family beta-lactamase induction signal transducer AmpG